MLRLGRLKVPLRRPGLRNLSTSSEGIASWLDWAGRNKGQAVLLYAGIFTAVVLPIQSRQDSLIKSIGLGHEKNFGFIEDRHRAAGSCVHGRVAERCDKHPLPVPHISKH